MLCIFCLQEKPPRTGSGEHPIPLSVGGTWTIQRVCIDCDSMFGHTHDARLTKVTKVAERREALKLAGNSGKVPSGLNEAFSRGPVAVADEPHHRMLVRQAADGSFNAKTIPNIEFEISKSEDGAVIAAIKPKTFVIGGKASEDEARDLIARKLKGALKDHGIYFADDIIAAAADKMFAEVEVFEKPIAVKVSREIINSGYAASLLKAGYEAAWYWLGDGWLSDPEADRIRRHLQGDESITIRGKIQEGEIRAVNVSPTNREHAHVIYLVHTGKSLAVEVHLFDLFSIGVLVTNDPDNYKLPDSGAIVMDAVNGACREIRSKDLF